MRNKTLFRFFRGCLSAFLLLLLTLLSACAASEEAYSQDTSYLYYRAADNLGSGLSAYAPSGDNTLEVVRDYIDQLSQTPSDTSLQKLLPDGVEIKSVSLNKSVVTLDFSSSYQDMDTTTEVLVRSGFVRTLVQEEGVDSVIFTVEGKPLKDDRGQVIGAMDKNTFVENSGKSVNSYQNANITLYFADSTGRTLVAEGRSIYYSSNKPLEWAVVERIIAGPKVDGHLATVSSDTQILSVTTQDDTCYVNLNSSFLQQAAGVSPEVAVYSIVNSIIRNSHVSSVQIAVEGSTSVLFAAEMDLDTFYEENSDLVRND